MNPFKTTFNKTLLVTLFFAVISSSLLIAQERVAVFDFRVTSGMSDNVAVTLTNKFRNEMAKTGNYIMVERSAMEQVLSEQRFSASDLADQDKAVQLGRLLSASKVVVADIGKIGNTYSTFVRLIDVQTASIENSESLEYEGEQSGLLKEYEILAQKLAGTYVEKKKRGWLYATGVAVLGGAAAGFLLLSNGGGSGSLPGPPSPPSN
ncbi:MAG: hypothetical protein CL670_07850 [Balneola sp.]|jgi:hypothetical protein|nr:hypothetical protein [Balneola sp.]MBE79050.1 hypothetical protein [Balneola sp.]|tara:strand:- start:990 stop:1610 length:621 start_codon:yes stop_codon:yes gene_type:complete